jgi:hypothetical protein
MEIEVDSNVPGRSDDIYSTALSNEEEHSQVQF